MAKAAPNFKLSDQDGKTHKLADYRGRWLVLYFYPHDNALGCTRQACSFRDAYRVINQFGNAQVVGVNRGSVSSHKNFAERHHLNFPILSDYQHKVTHAYGAWRNGQASGFDKAFGTRRNTYLINPFGKIVKEYLNVDPQQHAEQIIADLRSFQDGTPQTA